MHRPESTPDPLLAGHYGLTRRQMDAEGAILVVHDTTELDFTTHRALRGAGPVGEGTGGGFLQHDSPAVRADDGLLLGLAHRQTVVRRPVPPTRPAPSASGARASRPPGGGASGASAPRRGATTP